MDRPFHVLAMLVPRRFRSATAAALILCMCAPAWSCQRQHTTTEPMTPETFMKVFVALRRADAESDSQPQFEARKQEILSRNGVTADQLQEFLREYSLNPQKMADLWDTVEARLRAPPADSAGSDTVHVASPAGVPDTIRRPITLPRRDTLRRPGMLRRDTLSRQRTLRRPGTSGRDTLPRPDTLRRPGAHPPGALR